MEIYTLKDIEFLILNSNLFLAKKSQEQKSLLLDKHNFVLNLIISKNLAEDNPFNYFVNINSTTLKSMLGDRYYNDILNNLNELKIIDINDSYSTTNFSKSYSIKKDIIEKNIPIRTNVKSIRFEEKLKKFINKKFIEINKNTLFNKILLNT